MSILKPIGTKLDTGRYSLDLGKRDGQTFQGPIKVSRAGQALCTVSEDVGIVILPIGVVRESLIYISTYSGSEQQLFVVDARTCAVRWTSVRFYGTGPTFRRNSIQLNDAGTFRIGSDGLPVR